MADEAPPKLDLMDGEKILLYVPTISAKFSAMMGIGSNIPLVVTDKRVLIFRAMPGIFGGVRVDYYCNIYYSEDGARTYPGRTTSGLLDHYEIGDDGIILYFKKMLGPNTLQITTDQGGKIAKLIDKSMGK